MSAATIKVEDLLTDYMSVVRANGTVQAVGSVDPDDSEEIIWEVIETHENLHGSLVDSDPIWPLARAAAQMAITICQLRSNEVIR